VFVLSRASFTNLVVSGQIVWPDHGEKQPETFAKI
jgi:hypothetical protein